MLSAYFFRGQAFVTGLVFQVVGRGGGGGGGLRVVVLYFFGGK